MYVLCVLFDCLEVTCGWSLHRLPHFPRGNSTLVKVRLREREDFDLEKNYLLS